MRVAIVSGLQTCALPICAHAYRQRYGGVDPGVAPGTRFAEKATEALIEAVEGGRIHRGGVAAATGDSAETASAARPVEHRSGVTIHRGPAAGAVQHGVTIHAGAPGDDA